MRSPVSAQSGPKPSQVPVTAIPAPPSPADEIPRVHPLRRHSLHRSKRMDCRVKPGNDGRGSSAARRDARVSSFRSVVVAVIFTGENLLGDEAGVLADGGLDLGGDVGIVLEEELGVLAALADALAVVGEPGARLLHHAGLDPEVDELAVLRHALAVHDVELDLLERRRELVLDHLDPGLVADHLVALLDHADAADVEP